MFKSNMNENVDLEIKTIDANVGLEAQEREA